MDWFSLLFLAAALIALVTGRAYFRGVVTRADAPRRYWSTVGGYAAVALASAALSPATGVPGFAWVTDFMTDAATRLAADLRHGAERMGSAREATRVVIHKAKPAPEGCRYGYRVQLSAQSSLVVWCKSETGEQTISSHTTTSHLPSVDVPRTWIIDKRAGEPLYVELIRTAAKPAVNQVY